MAIDIWKSLDLWLSGNCDATVVKK